MSEVRQSCVWGVPILFLLVGGPSARPHSDRQSAQQTPEMVLRAQVSADQWDAVCADNPSLSQRERAVRLRALARHSESPVAVAMLIRWLEFRPTTFGVRSNCGETSVPSPSQFPAVPALKAIGAFAAPQLVEEYLFFFENTAVASRQGRAVLLACDGTGTPLAVQNPNFRLRLLTEVMSSRPTGAQKAVEVATQLMQKEALNDRTVRACRELIGRIKAQFPEAEHPKLFPAALIAN